MFETIWRNGRIVELGDAGIEPTSAGVLYGWGVFTTLGIRSSRAQAFELHWERLISHAARAQVPMTTSASDASDGLRDLIRASGIVDGRARITVLRGRAGFWSTEATSESDTLIFVGERAVDNKPIAMTVSPYRLNASSPIAGVKCTAFIDYLLALEEARTRSFDEAVLLNERGELVEATTANLFWARDGELFTPSLSTGAVAGVTRRLAIAAATARRVRVSEASHPLAALGEADEVFLTSSGRGLVSVSQFDLHSYDAPGSMAILLGRDVDAALARDGA